MILNDKKPETKRKYQKCVCSHQVQEAWRKLGRVCSYHRLSGGWAWSGVGGEQTISFFSVYF